MSKTSEQMDKLAPKSATGQVLVAIHLSQGREDMEPLPRDEPGPTHEDCRAAFAAVSSRLAGKIDKKDEKSEALRGAIGEYLTLRDQIKAALDAKKGKPEKILEAIDRLEPLFLKGWANFMGQRDTAERQAAARELEALEKQAASARDAEEEARKAGERVRLQQYRDELKQKDVQLALLEQKLKDGDFTGKKDAFQARIDRAKREQAEVKAKLAPLADVAKRYDDAVRSHQDLVQRFKESQRRVAELSTQQAEREGRIHKLAADVGERCDLLLKDDALPARLASKYADAQEAIEAPDLAKAQWLLDDLPSLLDKAESEMREAHPRRDDFIARLDLLEEPIAQVDDDELALAPDRAALKTRLKLALAAASQRDYDKAIAECDALEKLLAEVEQRIEDSRQAQDAFQADLADVQESIDDFLAGTTTPHEVELTEQLVQKARDTAAVNTRAGFESAREFIKETLKPKVDKLLEEQKRWSKVERAPRAPRTPPAPPNYGQAADTIVREVLKLFRSRFDYAGPSFDASQFFPRTRFDPLRLKRAVRDRFNRLTPSTELTGLGLNSKHYFNLGAGGTTKKAYEYNVKVKKSGELRALAQIHVIYLS